MPSDDLLTDDEMGALMDSVSSDPVNREELADGQGYMRFDFARREQGLLAQVPALEFINERQLSALSQGLLEEFRVPVVVEITETRIIKLDELLKSVPINACINLFRLKPLSGVSVLVVPADLLSLLIDSCFGGALKENYSETSERSLTASEMSINRRINERFLRSIAIAWKDVLPLSPEYTDCETKPELIPVRSGDELAVMFNFEIELADRNFTIQWLFPYAALESIRQLLASSAPETGIQSVDADWEPIMRKELMSIDTELTAVFAKLELPLGEILELSPGSVIQIRMPEKVGMFIEDTRVAEAEYGASNGKKAVKLIS